MGLSLVLTTVSSRAQAEKLARLLLEKKLAACVSRWPVQSVYRWNGKMKASGECALEIKAPASKAKALAAWLEENHPHKLPMIVSIGAPASKRYERWAARECR